MPLTRTRNRPLRVQPGESKAAEAKLRAVENWLFL